MLITVRIVAPAAGSPDTSPAQAFATPWPINSLFESCVVWLRLSATSDVSSESIAPSTARTAPALSTVGQ